MARLRFLLTLGSGFPHANPYRQIGTGCEKAAGMLQALGGE